MSGILRVSDAASLALHTMTLLAAEPEQSFSAREIAGTFDASEAHLSKVLQRLAHVGLVRSERGPHGGYALRAHGQEVTLLQIYEAIEGPLEESRCLLGTPVCGKHCLLGGLMQRLNAEAREYLTKTRLADLAETRKCFYRKYANV